MKQDLPFVVLGAPTSGATGERLLIKAHNAVVFGIENGYDITPSKWEKLVTGVMHETVDASNCFMAYETTQSSGITGYFVAARCYESAHAADDAYDWLLMKAVTPFHEYNPGVWCVKHPALTPDPFLLDTKSRRDFVSGLCGTYMSCTNFERRDTRGIVWEILPSVPFGRIIVHPFGQVSGTPAVETCVRPDLSVLWR